MLQAAEQHYQLQARLAAAAARAALTAWSKVPLGALDRWQALDLAGIVTALQLAAAESADPYVTAALLEQGIAPDQDYAINAVVFAGVAGDGRSLVSLLDQPRIRAKTLIGLGWASEDAWRNARASLQTMAATAVQDAGRGAVQVATAARPHVTGFVRMLTPPSCSRCTVLAGRWYRYNAGFDRHPRCDCIGIPANEDTSGDLRTNPRLAIESGNVTGLSRADSRAILDDGADVGQVINAHRGMYTADLFGRRLQLTTEGITKRGLAGQRLGNFEQNVARDEGQRYRRSQVPRLRPESIYRVAGDDRAEALRLLRRFGYLI
jgi:hypothetical protein